MPKNTGTGFISRHAQRGDGLRVDLAHVVAGGVAASRRMIASRSSTPSTTSATSTSRRRRHAHRRRAHALLGAAADSLSTHTPLSGEPCRSSTTDDASPGAGTPAGLLALPDERLPDLRDAVRDLRRARPQLRGRPDGRRPVRPAAGGGQHLAAAALVDHLRLRHARHAAQARKATLAWLAITGLFGARFLGIELYEFAT
jgi:hypothetical protein